MREVLTGCYMGNGIVIRAKRLYLRSEIKIGGTMKIATEAEASKDLKAVLDHVVDDADIAIITRLDDKAAVVMGRDHYNSLMETLYLLESPANAEHLARSVGQFRGRDKD